MKNSNITYDELTILKKGTMIFTGFCDHIRSFTRSLYELYFWFIRPLNYEWPGTLPTITTTGTG